MTPYGQRVPFLARHLACLAPHPHRGVGEEADPLRGGRRCTRPPPTHRGAARKSPGVPARCPPRDGHPPESNSVGTPSTVPMRELERRPAYSVDGGRSCWTLHHGAILLSSVSRC